MKTIIAEKPSVAKEIAHIVGADKREEGYMQGNGYYVTLDGSITLRTLPLSNASFSSPVKYSRLHWFLTGKNIG